MRKMSLIVALAAALPVAASARLQPSPAPLLASKVAGQPKQCLTDFQRNRESRAYASGDILYRGTGSTWYLNHPVGCPPFRTNIAFSTVTTEQLCRGDIVRINEVPSGVFLGSCALGEFVPYTDRGK